MRLFVGLTAHSNIYAIFTKLALKYEIAQFMTVDSMLNQAFINFQRLMFQKYLLERTSTLFTMKQVWKIVLQYIFSKSDLFQPKFDFLRQMRPVGKRRKMST